MRTSAVLALLLLLIAGCEQQEHAILIQAYSQSDVSTVQVSVSALDGTIAPFRSGERPIDRSQADIDAEPIRVAVELERAAYVLVHLSARDASGGRLVATRCYDVQGVVEDELLLVGPLTTSLDGDEDGFARDPATTCFESDASTACDFACPRTIASDCDDADATRYPGAPEICADGIDQDCNQEDAPCSDSDGDGWRACSQFDPPGTCDCDDSIPTINPEAEEVCADGIDQDCNGRDALCDLDDDGFVADRAVGGSPDCDDTDPDVNPSAQEVCTPEGEAPKDEDCDGLTDELEQCAPDDLDRDGYVACSVTTDTNCDCNDCDPGTHPGAAEVCSNGIDEDCDGQDRTCASGDADKDGHAARAAGGTDCDDADPRIFPNAPELCGDGTAQNCQQDVSCTGDTDGDGYVEPNSCEGDPAITPWNDDVCNGVDDDCDGTTDEVLAQEGTLDGKTIPASDWGCVVSPRVDCGTASCVVDFRSNPLHCGGCRNNCNPGGTRIADRCVSGQCDCAGQGGTTAPCIGTNTCCSTGCHDLEVDLNNCGSCGAACNADPSRPLADRCVGGRCQCGTGPACTSTSGEPRICCNGQCIDPRSSEAHCGACGNRCGQRMQCSGGQCRCDSPYLDCDGDQRTGCEVDPRINDQHCGECGEVCRSRNGRTSCIDSACAVSSCDANYDDCDDNANNGCETSLTTLSDCGSCGQTCSLQRASETCATGSCRIDSCDSGWGNCNGSHSDGCETSLTSLSNCMSCGQTCALDRATETCSSGSCRIDQCDTNWGDCDNDDGTGCETSLTTLSNCGDCGDTCALDHATESCSTGQCEISSCEGSWRDCNETDSDGCEVDTNESTDHCGGCNSPCDKGEKCCSGQCRNNC